MKRFAELLDRLAYTPSRNGKLRLMRDYFATAPDPDRGWALAALTDQLSLSLPMRRTIAALMEPRVDPVLFALSRDYVGDTAETVALLWPEAAEAREPPRLSEIVEALRIADRNTLAERLAGWLDCLDPTGRWALLKLVTGALRVGVSARLAKLALAQYGGVEASEIEEVWHGVAPPYGPLFAWLAGEAGKPDTGALPVFRPLMLSVPLADEEIDGLDPDAFWAEWKWDGIRVQLVAQGGETRLFSRTGDDIGRAFPDLLASVSQGVVLDGELLVVRDGLVAPFNDLQQRLNRKTVTPRMMAQFPAHLRLYDILIEGGDDLRPLPLEERRARLVAWYQRHAPPRLDLSPLVPFESAAELRKIWGNVRSAGIEGLMLKRRASPYLAGRFKGHWFKWKRAPLTVDAVLMYAQRGSGKRSSYYSDYTFGCWRMEEGRAAELVPVGKAYFGFTDEELLALDRWIRGHTAERFGPVRAVEPSLVLEVAFDAVHPSTRHKSGVAMRFPRIHRIRWDKPAAEADRLDALLALIEG